MWSLIEARLSARGVPVDRSGIDRRACETYPRADRAAWGSRTVGKVGWAELEQSFPSLSAVPGVEPVLASPDVCDAVACALAARARAIGVTLLPESDDDSRGGERAGFT